MSKTFGMAPGYWGATPIPGARPKVDPTTERMARASTHAPRVSFDTFLANYFEWRPGEHVTLIGPTGQGKSVLSTQLVNTKPFVVCIGTKPRDDTLDDYINQYGFERLDKWESIPPTEMPRRIIWPDMLTIEDKDAQSIYRTALNQVYRQGAWVLALDELQLMCDPMGRGGYGLEGDIVKLYGQGRSMKISVIANGQRPRNIPMSALSQATHLFFWRTTDDNDLDRIGGLGTLPTRVIHEIVQHLDRYEFLYVNVREDIMCRSKTPNPDLLRGEVNQ